MRKLLAPLFALFYLAATIAAQAGFLINAYQFAAPAGCSIALRGTPTTGSAINGGNITLNMPTGVAQDDVVVVGYAMTAIGTGGTSSSGWTQIGADVSNTTIRIQVFRKIMSASPDANIVLTGTGSASDSSSAVAIAFDCVSTVTPEDGVALTSFFGNTTNPDPPSITPTTTGDVAIAYAATSLVDTTGTGAPSGYSDFSQVSSSDTNSNTSYLAWKGSLTGGVAENPAAFSGVSSARWVAYSIVLKPQ